MSLAGMSAVVVGGSSGIGLEAARLFVEEGAKVAIVGRQQHRLDKATAAFTGNIIAVSADVSRPDEINLAMQQIVDRTGPIDVLFVSAGVSDAPPFSQTTEAAFDHLIGINLKGTFFAVLHALPHLRDGASVILTGSVAGRKGRPGDPLYAASKGAVRSFGRTLATSEEILARRIRVNVLTPGPIVTPLTAEATEIPAVRDFIAEMVPLGRWGEAREVAQVVKFLASDASSYITGAEITVDGGLAHV